MDTNNPEKLSRREAQDLRDSLLGYIEKHPAKIKRSAIVHRALQRGISLFLLAAFPSLSLLYVAGKALPSHGWLYEVKRGAEEVAVYLQPNTAGRISYRTEQIDRRVSEATQITLSGEVNSFQADRLERDLVAHVAQVEEDLKSSKVTPEEKGDAKNHLAAKTKVLGVLAGDENTSIESRAALERMLTATALVSSEEAVDNIENASSTSINHDLQDAKRLNKASETLAGVRVDVRLYIEDSEGTSEVASLIADDLNKIIDTLTARLTSLEELEHLSEKDRENLDLLLVDLEAFSELFNADPLVARSFTIEIDPSVQTAPLSTDVSLPESQTETNSEV